jgi:hypothetical protein
MYPSQQARPRTCSVPWTGASFRRIRPPRSASRGQVAPDQRVEQHVWRQLGRRRQQAPRRQPARPEDRSGGAGGERPRHARLQRTRVALHAVRQICGLPAQDGTRPAVRKPTQLKAGPMMGAASTRSITVTASCPASGSIRTRACTWCGALVARASAVPVPRLCATMTSGEAYRSSRIRAIAAALSSSRARPTLSRRGPGRSIVQTVRP